jgi:hypothetical protein
MVWHRHRKL